MDIGSLNAAINSAKLIAQIVQGLNSLSKDAAVSSEVVKLNSAIFHVQSELFAAQAREASLSDRIKKLEADIVQFEEWEEEKKRYQLSELAPGTFVYRIKPECQGSDPTHCICPQCYQQKRKSILQSAGVKQAFPVHVCSACKAEFVGDAVKGFVEFSEPSFSHDRRMW